MFNTFQEATLFWKDTPEVHSIIFKQFFDLVQRDDQLRKHRDYIEANDYGFGDRPFHWMWNLICQDLPYNFKFLEIGVFKGQVISLISLLNQRFQKGGKIYGLTPFSAVGDASNYPDVDYKVHISNLYDTFNLRMSDVTFIQGLSTDHHSIEQAKNLSPFDCIYIDGGHDYETVVNDILSYAPLVATGGLLVMDDSANYLNIPDGLIRLNWRGIIDVSNAVRDYLEGDPSFEHIFSCGHNRVWRKLHC
jgi:hypothetical protein